jgi:hypothetical protein
MRRLADQPQLRDEVGCAGQRHWETHHRLELMASDYRRLLPAAASRPAPTPSDLPGHFLDDYSGLARATIRRFGLPLDILD